MTVTITSTPDGSKSAAKTTVYREETHCACVRDNPKSTIITGSETATIVPSKTISETPK